MVKVDNTRYKVYLERAKDCYKSLKALQIIYYDGDIKPEYLREFSLDNFDVIFMLYSISVISLVNSLTIKLFGEKAKDHNDLSLYRRLKSVFPELSNFDNLIFEINNIKNASEYGDTHMQNNKHFNEKRLQRFIEFCEDRLNNS